MGYCMIHAHCKVVMCAIAGALWDDASSEWDPVVCMHAAQALCGILHPLCELLQPLCGLSLANTGNEDR